eukprot:750631-Hanusia_phi.AAC.1
MKEQDTLNSNMFQRGEIELVLERDGQEQGATYPQGSGPHPFKLSRHYPKARPPHFPRSYFGYSTLTPPTQTTQKHLLIIPRRLQGPASIGAVQPRSKFSQAALRACHSDCAEPAGPGYGS